MHYRREIDGLRALAVIPVILFHAGFETFGGGFIGVDVFFVISGYLITSIIVAEMELGTFSIVTFYERRARRILPALFLVMAVCIPFAWMWLLPNDMKDFSGSLVAVSLFSSNILFLRQSGYFDTAAELKPLLHTWSLAVEEQYYVLFPLFLLFAWRLGRRWIVAVILATAILSLALAEWGSVNYPEATFFLLPARGWELAIGALVAFYLAQRRELSIDGNFMQLASGAGLVLILSAIFAFDRSTPFPSLYALVPTLGTALVILFASPGTAVGKILGGRVLVSVGLISYSAYLWHQPLFAFAKLAGPSEPSFSLLMLLSVAALALAWFSWRFVEQPFRHKQLINRNSVFSLAIVTSSFFIVFGLVGHLGGFPMRYGDEYQALLRAKDKGQKNPYCRSAEGDASIPKGACVIGDVRTNAIALVGDSHAWALAYEFSKAMVNAGRNGIIISRRGCPPIRDVYDLSRRDKECEAFNGEVSDFLVRTDSIEYIILTARWTKTIESKGFNNQEGGIERGRPILMDVVEGEKHEVNTVETRERKILEKFVQTIELYLSKGKKVVLIYDVPEAGWNVPDYLIGRLKESGTLIAQDGSTSYDLIR